MNCQKIIARSTDPAVRTPRAGSAAQKWPLTVTTRGSSRRVDDFLLIRPSRDQRHTPFAREDPHSDIQPCPDRASNLFSNRQIDSNAFKLDESTNNRVFFIFFFPRHPTRVFKGNCYELASFNGGKGRRSIAR